MNYIEKKKRSFAVRGASTKVRSDLKGGSREGLWPPGLQKIGANNEKKTS